MDLHLMRARADDLVQFGPHGAYPSVCIGNGQDAVRRRVSALQDVGDTQGEDGGLAGARACNNHDRTLDLIHGLFLGGVETGVGGSKVFSFRRFW
jgi:hypothetical protein